MSLHRLILAALLVALAPAPATAGLRGADGESRQRRSHRDAVWLRLAGDRPARAPATLRASSRPAADGALLRELVAPRRRPAGAPPPPTAAHDPR